MNKHTVKNENRAIDVPDEWAGIEQSYREHQERKEALIERQREQALEDLAEQEQLVAMDRQKALREQQIAEEEEEERERAMERWADRQ